MSNKNIDDPEIPSALQNDSATQPEYPPSPREKTPTHPIKEEPGYYYQTYGKWNVRIRLIVGLLLPTYLETLDYTVVATAQPHIASAFNRLDLQSWIGTSYVLASTVFLPIFGSIADVLGRQWACQLALLLFMIGSAICTGAQSMPMLLLGRGISGVGAAGLVSVVRIIFSDSGTLSEDSFLSAILVLLYAVGYATGPLIGGYLVQINFRWIFAINLPVSLVSSILIFILLRPVLKGPQPSKRRLNQLPAGSKEIPKETPLQKFLRIDWVGTLIFISAGILLLLGLSLGSSVEAKGFSAPVVIISLALGVFLLVVFVFWEWLFEAYAEEEGVNGGRHHTRPPWMYKSPKWLAYTDPVIPTTLFKNYDITATNFGAMISGMVMFSAFYFLAIYFSIAQGESASKAGQKLLLFAPGAGAGVFIAMRMIAWLRQPKYPSILGGIVIPIGLGLLSMAIGNNNEKQISGFLFMTGTGVGLSFAPLSLQARYSESVSMVAIVVSMNLFFRTAGGTIGLAQLSTVLNGKVKSYINWAINSSASPLNSAEKQSVQALFNSAGSLSNLNSLSSLDSNSLAIVQDAFRRGCRWSFISLIPWCIVSLILLLGLHSIPEERFRGEQPASTTTKVPEDAGVAGAGAGAEGATTTARRPEQPVTVTQPQRFDGQQKRIRDPPKIRGPVTALIWPVWRLVQFVGNKEYKH